MAFNVGDRVKILDKSPYNLSREPFTGYGIVIENNPSHRGEYQVIPDGWDYNEGLGFYEAELELDMRAIKTEERHDTMNDVKLIIRGVEYIVKSIDFDYGDHDSVKANVEAYRFESTPGHVNCMCVKCYKLLDSKENDMREVPKNLEKFLNDNYKAFYKLGWIDTGTLELNSNGIKKLNELLLTKYENELGKLAKEEVTKMEKAVNEAE